MIKKNYDIFSKPNGENVNIITNLSSKIYKNNILISNMPIGDFSRYVSTINNGFYIENNVCVFNGVTYFIEDNYFVVTSILGDSLALNSEHKTQISLTSANDYNTITLVLELTSYNNYLFFIWNDRWNILYKSVVSVPGEVWSNTLTCGYYILYIDTTTPPTTIINYDNTSDTYDDSFIVFYARGNTTISFNGSSSTQTIYLRSLDNNETFVKTTNDGIYIYSKSTKLGPFKVPFNVPCVLDFEYFINNADTDIYIYCNYFLVGNGKLINFIIDKNKQITINLTTISTKTTLVNANIYSLGLFISNVPCPAVVYDICSRSITSLINYAKVYDSDNFYMYKTDYSVWILDYYNNTVMVLYGDKLKKSTITSLYNNLLYSHNNYVITSYGFSLDKYKIVDCLYSNGIFILLLEDRLIIIDKFGTVLRYIYCRNVSKLFCIDDYILFYDRTRARLYRVYSNDFRNFEFPSVIFDVDFSTKFRVCQPANYGPFHVVDGDYISVVKEQSIFGYKVLYDYSSVRTYTIGSNTFSNLTFEYDIVQQATKFTGIMTSLGYETFANNPIEKGLSLFTLFMSIKPMSLQFKRYLVRIPDVLDVYIIDNKLVVDLKCVNTDISVKCTKVFNVNIWYDIYITYHCSIGLYIYINGREQGKKEFCYDTGGTLGQKYIIIGGYGADAYAAYKFDGFIRDEVFISRSFITSAKALDLNNNNVRNPSLFSEYNTYISVYGVTGIISNNGYMFVGAYDGLYIYDTSLFKLIKSMCSGSIILGIETKGDFLFANSVKIPAKGKISGLAGEVVKINGDYEGNLFISKGKACQSCVYNGNTYVELLGTSAYLVDVFSYIGNYTLHGYYNLGKMSIDSLNTEIQCISEFGYDEQNDTLIGYSYSNSTTEAKLINCCDKRWSGWTLYATSYTSAILYTNTISRLKYDTFIDVQYLNESLTSINLFDIALDIRYTESKLYKFIISRLDGIRMPYEEFSAHISEQVLDILNIIPIRLYHSESKLLNNTKRVKFYFEVSKDNLKLLKARTLKVLENYIDTSTRFAYDFRGGMGNGVKYKIENNTHFGVFDGTSYFINNTFEDTPVYEFSAEFVLRINSYCKFNPIFSKSTKSSLSYALAICDTNLKFLFGQNGIISVLDLEMPIGCNKLTFIGVYVSYTYIDILVNGIYKRVFFYGSIDVVESELYVGFGIYLNNRAAKFKGSMLYFDINKSGTMDSIYSDYSIYINAKTSEISYDEIINLNKYYDVNDCVFRLTSAFYSNPSNPLSRMFRLYNFYMIGSDETKEVSDIDTTSVFSSDLLQKSLKVNTKTLDYTLQLFSGCYDFSYDKVGNFYSVTKNNTIEYNSYDIKSIDKFNSITTIKYNDNFTLFGTFGGIVKISNIFGVNISKQWWPLNNGVNALLIINSSVYIAFGESLGFIQIDNLKKINDEIIIRDPMIIYNSDCIIKSVCYCNNKIYILSCNKIINISDNVEVMICNDAKMLFSYNNDILIVYQHIIKKLSNGEVILSVNGVITDISYGTRLVVSTSSGFYLLDKNNNFVFNSIGITGMLSNCEIVSDYCYHACITRNLLIYIYRDINAIKLVEFDIDNKKVINNVILSNLVDGSFSNYVPYTFNSVGL